jgi:regulator of replication initiation timing
MSHKPQPLDLTPRTVDQWQAHVRREMESVIREAAKLRAENDWLRERIFELERRLLPRGITP